MCILNYNIRKTYDIGEVMNLNQLQYFIAVAECNSFTKAAAQFYISQTAITQQIQVLEEQLGVKLFSRSTRPISLTPAGALFLTEARAICERMQLAKNRVMEAADGIMGTIKIGYTKGYEQSKLPGLIHQFHRDNPGSMVQCYRHNSDALGTGLLNGDYDVIFTWDSSNIVADRRIAYCEFERVPLVVAMDIAHPLAHKSSIKRQDLRNEKILYMSPAATGQSYGDNHFMDLYRKAGYIPDILFYSNDIESILMMVSAQEGISILPAYGAQRILPMDNVVFCPLEGDEEYETIICAWEKDSSNQVLRKMLTQWGLE